MQRHPMTPEGHKKLSETLKHLKEVVRPQIVKDIEEARAHGDLSENSEYEDAKERQSLTEGRIRDMEAKLAASEIIDVTKMEPSDRVVFGTTVVVEDLETEEESQYRIVGENESDVKSGLISVLSPIARALIGREIDDEVTVRAPGGDRKMVITDVLYK
ncbi:MAG: transcription elongation factor GreA [Myxococcota bacterium]|mgnify:FL=1|jgi:transcription elongation factor GreA|nr:transcription elongation factor GreA [Myxococcota bacterium]MEC9390014.1 transcription elongation factor GreA [Myxococcota bacterium]